MSDDIAMPKPGESAPDIDEPTATGSRFRLADHLGQWVVVYFYSRANTPG
jgi:peroxiredoxin